MWAFIGVVSFLSFIVFLIVGIVSVIRKQPTVKRNFIITGASFFILIVAFAADPTDTTDVGTEIVSSSPSSSPVNDISKTNTTVKESSVESDKSTAPPTETSEPIPKPTSKPTPEPTVKETASQRNAVRTAQDYLAFTAFSRKGLIDQLKFEGYSSEDATYAVDKIDVDWNEQAVKVAQSYLDFSSFSKQGLKEQLEFEGFTSEQAEYGVNQAYR